MTPVFESFAAEYEAEARTVARARAELTRFAATAGAGDQLLDEIALAVSEAVTNVVVHAYGDETGRVRVRATADAQWILITVADDGVGIGRGREHPTGPGLGIGLRLIGEVSDDLAVAQPPERGTEVRIRFDRRD